MYNMGDVNKLTLLLKFGAMAGSIMLFVFTLKFIFKLKNHKAKNRIKLIKKDHPELWSFVDKVCSETGAPRPKKHLYRSRCKRLCILYQYLVKLIVSCEKRVEDLTRSSELFKSL